MKEKLKKNLESESKAFYKKNKTEVLDILLFGSVIRGKTKPNDLDLLIIFKEKKHLNLTYELRKIIEKATSLKVEITSKSYSELFQKTFLARESILSEGYSLIHGCFFSEGLGFKTKIMFHYALKGKNKSERMRFYYSLYGRNSEGILRRLNSVKYTDTIILCPVENQEEMKEFFNSWEMEFNETPILIPERLV